MITPRIDPINGGSSLENDYYRILGVDPTADAAAIKDAFRKKVMVCHPDRGGTHERMVLVNAAWEILSHPELRARYDLARTQAEAAPAQAEARADAEVARQRAEHYPKTWAEAEVWLGGLSEDFAKATYGSQAIYGELSVPTAGRSVTGWAFIAIGGLLGGALISPFMVDLYDAPHGIHGAEILTKLYFIALILGAVVPVLCNAWAGITIHLWISSSMKSRGSNSPVPPPEPNSATAVEGRIVACSGCGQKLRVPVTAEELVVTCGACQLKFACPPEVLPAPAPAPPPAPNQNVLSNLGTCAGILVALYLLGLFVDGNLKRTESESKRILMPHTLPSRTAQPPGATPPAVSPAQPGAQRIAIEGFEATADLVALLPTMTAFQKQGLKLGSLPRGEDTYAAIVRITNTGAVPVAVSPGHVKIQLSAVNHSVWTIAHPECMGTSVIQPGRAVEGMVFYQAKIEAVAKVRLGGGATIRYSDPAVRVDYP